MALSQTVSDIVGIPQSKAVVGASATSPTVPTFVEVGYCIGIWAITDILYGSILPSPAPKIRVSFALDSAGLTTHSEVQEFSLTPMRNTNRVERFDLLKASAGLRHCSVQLINGEGASIQAYVALAYYTA